METLFKTAEEAEKEVISKHIELQMISSSIMLAFDAVRRFIRIIYIIVFIVTAVASRFYNIKQFFITICILTLLYIIFAVIVSWVKFNMLEEFNNIHCNMTKMILENCEELQNEDLPDWQKIQMKRNIATKVGINIENNNK
jgi:hypothetical protein